MPHPAPKRALQFLRWFCRDDYLEEIEGNLVELFEIEAMHDLKKAKWRFYLNVLFHFRPDYIRSFQLLPSLIRRAMLKNYFKVGIRNIAKNKTFSAINITSLVLGMVCFLFIFLWVQDERKMDNFHGKRDRLFNIYTTTYANGEVHTSLSPQLKFDTVTQKVSIPIEEIKNLIPEVEMVNFYSTGYERPWGKPETFKYDNKRHKLEGARAGADFFRMFDYPIIAGDQQTPLSDLSSIAISRKMANLFFTGPEAAIGQTLRYEDRLDFKVTAVFEDVEVHSSLKFDFLLSWDMHTSGNVEWANNQFLFTVLLTPEANIDQVTTRINKHLANHFDQNDIAKTETGLQPFRDKYLVANFTNGKPSGGRIEYVRIFSGVALFILILACINFMNLSTARSARRAREVGVRKVIGSTRWNLIGQFLSESVLLSMIALILTLITVQLLLPWFNGFTGKSIRIPYSQISYWLIALGLMITTGILAGSYPAFFLSSLKPIKVLRGVLRFKPSSDLFRKSLTVFQFGLSTFLLVVAIVVSKQTDYVQHSHLGYDRSNLLYLRIEGELMQQEKYNLFKNRAGKMPGIAMIDRSSEAPHIMGFEVTAPVLWEGTTENQTVGFLPSSVGYDFVELMDLELVAGRDFSRSNSRDSSDAFIVNEEAVRQMGLNDPIGKSISAWNKKGHIVGVLKDFHTHSLHSPIKPLIIDVKEYEYFGVILVRTLPGQTNDALASLKEVYAEVNPNYPFNFEFIDQEYQSLYASEQVVSSLSNIFAGLAILISCLGLLGLAIFHMEKRLKEISVRKVLGASMTNILFILSKDFMALVGLAFIIAVPISWFIMNNWLQGFAYRIELSWWIFILAGIISIVIAMLIISSQSLRVAFANPMNALKRE